MGDSFWWGRPTMVSLARRLHRWTCALVGEPMRRSAGRARLPVEARRPSRGSSAEAPRRAGCPQPRCWSCWRAPLATASPWPGYRPRATPATRGRPRTSSRWLRRASAPTRQPASGGPAMDSRPVGRPADGRGGRPGRAGPGECWPRRPRRRPPRRAVARTPRRALRRPARGARPASRCSPGWARLTVADRKRPDLRIARQARCRW